MTNVQPTINPSARYNEAQAARLLDVTTRTIRRWRDAGHMRALPQRPGTNRVYFKGVEIIRAFHTH